MRLFIIFFSLLLFNFSIVGQVGGERIYEFLNISTSARQIALGGKVLTFTNDVNQPIWNPSVINNNLDNQLALNYTSYLANIQIGSVSYAKEIDKHLGTFHIGAKYINYGTFIGADQDGNETGDFGANDIALTIGYSYNIPWTDFYLGANLKLINATISNYSSFGIATDIALLYYNIYKPYKLTLVVRNLGTQIKSFNGILEDLPLDIAFGGEFKPAHIPVKLYGTLDYLHKWNISVSNPSNASTDLEGNTTDEEISFFNNALRHLTVGFELFPENIINIRAGYSFRKSQELQLQNLRTFAGISFGFGIQLNSITINYAYSKIHSATNISTFSLYINLDKNK